MVDDGAKLPHKRGYHKAIQSIYGIKNADPAVQDLGSVTIKVFIVAKTDRVCVDDA